VPKYDLSGPKFTIFYKELLFNTCWWCQSNARCGRLLLCTHSHRARHVTAS